ncbi:MAG: PKD domain-containing protein [Marinoscillum sp.]
MLLGVMETYAQCSSIRQQRNITFNTDKDCAPVTVTDFTITYFFNTPQNPSDVSIQFEWNDPGNNVDVYSVGDAAFTADVTNTEFTAVGTFTYPENDECVFQPVSSFVVDGTVCETSRQVQIVTSWAPDNDFGGEMLITPEEYDVCFNNAVVNAVFEDNSTFNCNVNLEPDNPNRQQRHTQFVYGTNHNAAASIRNLSMVDDGGVTINLTDGAANLSSTVTRSGVSGAYFGAIVQIPFPADGPTIETFPISAPADVNNLVGNDFEITLYNWNICNPYNGDPNNPNYDEAVSTTAYIRIVDPPTPDYQTRLNTSSGPLQTVFCLGEDIYFENLSTNAGAYTWEFYDDATGTSLVSTSNDANPTFTYTSAGDKLIRLTAGNPNAQGSCIEQIERAITMSPATMAGIGLFDDTFSSTIDGIFCVDGGTVRVGFRDETTSIEPGTDWRWEIYDTDGTLRESIPTGSGTYGAQVTDFVRTFSTPGIYEVYLYARNTSSLCESIAVDSIILYDQPDAFFESTTVCEGERTTFLNIADSLGTLTPRVNNDYVSLYEWDLSYDGSTFNPELSFTNSQSFSFYLDGNDYSGTEPATSQSGTFQVALRMTTAIGECSDIYQEAVTVNPLPEPLLASSYTTPICPDDSVDFFNNSNLTNTTYQLVVTDSLTYYDTLAFNQTDTTYQFQNTRDSSSVYYVSLIGLTSNNCTAQSEALTIEVLPSAPSGFNDPNYSVTTGNCSIWESTLVVNNATQALDADSYTWSISDQNGVLAGYPVVKNSGDPDFHELDYSLENATNSNQAYTATLMVEKSGICVVDSQRDFIINPQPRSTFTITIADSCTYKTVVLEADQKGLPSYQWTFDPAPDQRFDDEDVQTLTYFRPDAAAADLSIDVSLKTENLALCESDTTFESFIVERSETPIVADFTLDPDTLVLPDSEVSITNTSSGGTGFLWDFGDGSTSNLEDPISHSYTNSGIYRIRFTVSNTYCETSIARNLVVEPADPVIDFSANVLMGCSPLTVQFINNSQYANPDTYYWEFGDGNTSFAENPTHTYARSGVYSVRLYGANTVGSGADLIREDYIEVYSQPIANFTLTPSTVYIPDQDVYFRNSSINATSYMWDFGDGITSVEFNPVHAYEELGEYNVTLIASNANGCSDTLTQNSVVQAVAGGREQTPNAFSPGGNGSNASDAVNDVFIPRVEGVSQFKMLIYNKWGQLLFESNSIENGWDGYFNGQLQPSDVYVYKLELTFSDGREMVKVGDVTLVR